MLHVTGQADGPGSCDTQGDCTTLRAAVTFANSPGADFAIDVPAGTYVLNQTLFLERSMTIDGAGADATFVDGGKAVQVFFVSVPAKVAMSKLTIRNGRIGLGQFGAGIHNRGQLTLTDVDVLDNSDNLVTTNSGGGGIANFGVLTLNGGSVAGNTAGVGGGIISFAVPDLPTGPVTIDGTSIVGNEARLAGGGIADFGAPTLDGATLDQNLAAFGGGLFAQPTVSHGAAWHQATVTARATTVSNNLVGLDGAGMLLDDGASVALVTSTITGNSAGHEGDGGNGGGIYNALGTLTMANDTVSDNLAPDGASSSPGNGHGGGIAQLAGTNTMNGRPALGTITTLMAGVSIGPPGISNGPAASKAAPDFVTIAGNTAGTRAASGGGAIFNGDAGGAFTVHDTIVAGSTGRNCLAPGGLSSQGYNLEDASDCGFTSTGDQTKSSPRLGSLADNGGPTLTMALTPGSPAVDAADPTCDQATDQRGVRRPQGVRCDIGAYELQATATTTPSPMRTAVPSPPVTGAGAVGGTAGGPPVAAWLAALAAAALVGLGLVTARYRRRT